MSELENVFRQSFANWSGNRLNPRATTQQPILSDWTDYFKSNANNLYDRLPTYSTQTTQEEPGWYNLSRFEKIMGFACCLGASLLCFVICIFMFPILALKPRKFGLLWSMGSLLFVVSFGILQGPVNYTKHLLSSLRIVFTTVFFASVLSTLYCAVVLKSSILTIITSIIELFAIAYYTFSYFPFGAQTLTFFSSYVMGYLGGFVGTIL